MADDTPHLLNHAPTPAQAGAALWVAALLGMAFLGSLPFLHVPLARYPGFIPVVDTLLLLGDVLTATLLFTHATLLRSRGLFALAGGYLFTGLIIIPHALTFPGAFSATGLLGAGPSTTIWLYFFWHMGLPLTVIAYAVLGRIDEATPIRREQLRTVVFASLAASLLVAMLLGWLATVGQHLLPVLMDNATDWNTSRVNVVALLLIPVYVVAMAMLLRRHRTVLDVWLLLVLWAWLLELLLVMGSSARFSAGWYVGRVAGLLSGVFVLLMLLSEMTRLYMRLSIALSTRVREREERTLTMDALATAIAHEVKQPLASIVANAGAGLASLERNPPDAQRIGRLFGSIEEAGLDAGGVIDSIRALFAQQPSQRVHLHVNEIVAEALSLMEVEATFADIQIAVDIDTEALAVNGDRLQLKHMLLNLFLNAVEAMRLVSGRERRLSIRSREHERQVRIEVADTGVGLDGIDPQRIFEAFYTTRSRGTGMGLSLCRSIVEAHGGKIRVSRGEPHGAVFHISLPAA